MPVHATVGRDDKARELLSPRRSFALQPPVGPLQEPEQLPSSPAQAQAQPQVQQRRRPGRMARRRSTGNCSIPVEAGNPEMDETNQQILLMDRDDKNRNLPTPTTTGQPPATRRKSLSALGMNGSVHKQQKEHSTTTSLEKTSNRHQDATSTRQRASAGRGVQMARRKSTGGLDFEAQPANANKATIRYDASEPFHTQTSVVMDSNSPSLLRRVGRVNSFRSFACDPDESEQHQMPNELVPTQQPQEPQPQHDRQENKQEFCDSFTPGSGPFHRCPSWGNLSATSSLTESVVSVTKRERQQESQRRMAHAYQKGQTEMVLRRAVELETRQRYLAARRAWVVDSSSRQFRRFSASSSSLAFREDSIERADLARSSFHQE